MFDFALLLAATINGLVLGSMYALASLGLTLQWGVLKVLNFSHGAFMTIGAYLVWLTFGLVGQIYPVAIVVVLIASFLMGIVFSKILIIPLQGSRETETNTFIATLAASTIIATMIVVLFGGRVKGIPRMVPGFIQILGVPIEYQQVLIMLTAPVLLAILMLFLQRTRTGMSVRAVAQDNIGATIVGVETKKVYAYTVGISCAFAGIAGILLGAYYFLSPTMGDKPLLIALFVMVLGGMGSVRGTIIGAYVIGIVDAFARFYVGVFWAEPILLVIFILLILFRPQGLYGVKHA